MRLEPLNRPSDLLISVVPFASCLAGPLLMFATPAAIGLGIAGVMRARGQPEPNYVLPLTGIVLGMMWVLLGAAALWSFRRGGALQGLLD